MRSLRSLCPAANKPRGIQAARKLRTSRRENRWADKDYNKRALGKFYKTSPTGGSSHAKGIVLEKVSRERKCAVCSGEGRRDTRRKDGRWDWAGLDCGMARLEAAGSRGPWSMVKLCTRVAVGVRKPCPVVMLRVLPSGRDSRAKPKSTQRTSSLRPISIHISCFPPPTPGTAHNPRPPTRR